MSKITVRRSTFVLIAVVLLFGGTMGATSVSAQSPDGEIAVSPTEVSLTQGESQTIAITYERISDATPQGIEYTITYDPAVISVTNQDQGSYLGGDALINNVSSPGEVEYAEVVFDGDSVETASGTVATITIEATSDVGDGETTPLEFTTAKASEGSTEFTITTTNGTVEAEVPTQEEGSTDTDSDREETTDEDSDSEETTGENADTEGTTDDAGNDSNRTEEVDNSTTQNETRTEAELNETADTETSSSTASEQPANDSSTGDGTPSEDDTSGATPGFGIKLSLIAVLAITYIVGGKTH